MLRRIRTQFSYVLAASLLDKAWYSMASTANAVPGEAVQAPKYNVVAINASKRLATSPLRKSNTQPLARQRREEARSQKTLFKKGFDEVIAAMPRLPAANHPRPIRLPRPPVSIST